MWNSLDLQCPIGDLVAYPPQDHYIMENLRDFVTVLTTAADALTAESSLWNEMKVLHNIQIKYKRILRCDRFLIFLQRVGHCLRKMVLLNLSKSYLDLAERFLVGFQDFYSKPLLPSRQQVEYVLIRTLSSSKLVCEAITYSRESFCYLIQKLKVGHLILDLIMATSIIARLNILLRGILEKLCSIYKEVLFWRYKVKKGEFQWAEQFNFPQDVEQWIKSFEPAYLKPLSMSKKDIDRVKSMLKQKNGINNKTEVSDSESIVLINEINVHSASSFSPSISIIETDIGEVIPRAKTENNIQNSLENKNIKTNHKLGKKKKVVPNHRLTMLQKRLLQKIMNAQSLKGLEDIWYEIRDLSPGYFPKALKKKKKEMATKLLTQIKAVYSDKKFNTVYKTKPGFLKTAIFHFCKKLGFTDNDIQKCKKLSVSSDQIKLCNSQPLVPVKTVSELTLLYKQLKEILKLKKDSEKLQLLKTIFKHRITDIKHLREKGKKGTAKKLAACASKEFLALYQ